jgi:hypothetical protein
LPLSHRFGRPKDVDHTPDRPPILFVSAYGQPGSYDPLAHAAEPAVKAKVIDHERPAAVPPDPAHDAADANGHRGDDPAWATMARSWWSCAGEPAV